MASRFSKKPDPSIKKNVQKARAEARKTKSAHASIVVTSLAATLFSWALFTNQDEIALEAARTANAQRAMVTIATPTQNKDRTISVTPAPLVFGITR